MARRRAYVVPIVSMFGLSFSPAGRVPLLLSPCRETRFQLLPTHFGSGQLGLTGYSEPVIEGV